MRSVRKRCGLSQRELAGLSGVSVSLIRKLEQGERAETRAETLRKLAVAMSVPTSTLLTPLPAEQPGTTNALWAPTSTAILTPRARESGEPATERGTADVLRGAVKLYHHHRYPALARLLPELLADSEDAPPLLRARILQLAGSVMVQTHHREAAHAALNRALTEATPTPACP